MGYLGKRPQRLQSKVYDSTGNVGTANSILTSSNEGTAVWIAPPEDNSFDTWYVNGQTPLRAIAQTPLEIVAGTGIAVTTKSVASVGIGTTYSKAITFGLSTATQTSLQDLYIQSTSTSDTTCWIPFVSNFSTGYQDVYLDSGLAFNASSNVITANLFGSVTGSLYGDVQSSNVVRSKQFALSDTFDGGDTYNTWGYIGQITGAASTSISLVGTSGTLPGTFEVVVTIYQQNTNLGSANDIQITKMLGVFDGNSIVSFTEYGTSYTNVSSSIANFDFDNTGDSNSLKLLINPTGVGNTTEYKCKVQLTYAYGY